MSERWLVLSVSNRHMANLIHSYMIDWHKKNLAEQLIWPT